MRREGRVALIHYGINRKPDMCAPSIEAHIRTPARAFGKLATFVHLYDQVGVRSIRTGEDVLLDREGWKLLRPDWIRLDAEDPPEVEEAFRLALTYGDMFSDDGYTLRNLVRQLHSIRVAY